MSGNSPTVTAIVQADDRATATLRAIAKIANETAKNMEDAAKGVGLASGADEAGAKVGRLSLIMKEAAASARQLAKDLALLAGPAILNTTWTAIKGAAQIQYQTVQNAIAGIQPKEQDQAAAQAASLAGQFPLVNTGEIIQLYRELRSVLKDTGEVGKMLPTIVQAKSVLDASNPSGQSSAGLLYSMRSAELFGLAGDPTKFRAYIDSFLKATQVEGRTINSEGLFEFAQMAKASAATLSPEFVNSIAPLLVQEMGGGRAGTSTDQFIKQVVGGFQGNLHSAAKEFVAMGLANKGDFETTKTGEIKGLKPGHHVRDYQIAASDPSKWVWDTLIPALKAKGFVTEEQQLNEVRRLFPNGNAANIVSKFVQQEETWRAKEERIRSGEGLNAIEAQREDPTAAIRAVTTAFDNLLATLTSPGMKDAALALSNFAEGVSAVGAKLAAWQKDHPKLAEGIADGSMVGGLGVGGALSYMALSKLFAAMTGNGAGAKLAGSALALDASAAALEKAAAALMGGAGKGGVGGPGGAPGGPDRPDGRGLGWGRILTSVISAATVAYDIANAPRVGSKESADNANATNRYWDNLVGGLLPDGWMTPAATVAPFAANPAPPRNIDLDPLRLGRYGMDDMRGGMDREAIRGLALSSLPAPGSSIESKLDALAAPIKIDPVTGTIRGEADLHISVDASGVARTDATLRLDGSIGRSQTVPSSARTGRVAGPN